MSENLTKLERNLGYSFKNKDLLKEALTHKSIKKNFSNERLEFLGDAVMDLIIGEYLFMNFKAAEEGDLSKLRAALVNEKSFANYAKKLEIGEYLFLSISEENNKGRQKNSLLSDAFEAIVGAIYLESGFDNCKKIVIKIIEELNPNISLEMLKKDYKTNLQEITQAIYGVTPTYKLLNQKGPDHQKIFEMALYLNDKLISSGVGKNKKEAEQVAAKIAIDMIEELEKNS